jgi:hypothetical protein
MKLYTEEQVKKMLEVCILSDLHPGILTCNDVLKTQTPIQLPSDEETMEVIKPFKNEIDDFDLGFRNGVQWLRDKIQGGNK